MKTAGNTGVALQGFGQHCLNMFVAQKMKMKTFFVELWHVCDTKSCVRQFCGGTINEIHHCLTSGNKHAIKLMMQ